MCQLVGWSESDADGRCSLPPSWLWVVIRNGKRRSEQKITYWDETLRLVWVCE